ncbi:hypothetical protein MRX96_023323 [Rhipicephalus microplus]
MGHSAHQRRSTKLRNGRVLEKTGTPIDAIGTMNRFLFRQFEEEKEGGKEMYERIPLTLSSLPKSPEGPQDVDSVKIPKHCGGGEQHETLLRNHGGAWVPCSDHPRVRIPFRRLLVVAMKSCRTRFFASKNGTA